MTARYFASIALVLAGFCAEPARAAEIGWSRDARTAFDAARRSGRPLLVDLYADWCGWCRTLEARVFSTPEFADYARGFELLRVDVEDGGEGAELAARYGAGNSLPTMLVLESSGALIGVVIGFHETPAFLERLREAFVAHQGLLAAYDGALRTRDGELVRATAGELHRRLDGARAAALYSRLIELEAPAAGELAWLRYYRADALRLARRFDEARGEAERARAAAPSDDRRLAERLELLPFWIARDAERCADARDVLAGFAERHPSSSLLPVARNALERLRGGGASCS